VRSRRLSNISTKLPKAPIFFLDRTFGGELLANELRSWHWQVEVHRRWYGDRRKVEDDEWIRDIGQKNWRIITADKDMEWRWHESIVKANAAIFVLASLKESENYEGWIRMLEPCKRRIIHDSHFAPRPFVARISHEGHIYKVSQLLAHGIVRDVTHTVKNNAELYKCA
jgi:PIN like domain